MLHLRRRIHGRDRPNVRPEQVPRPAGAIHTRFEADGECGRAVFLPGAPVLADRDGRGALPFDDGGVAAAGGEGRPGNGPVNRFSPERAKPWRPHPLPGRRLRSNLPRGGDHRADLLVLGDLTGQVRQVRRARRRSGGPSSRRTAVAVAARGALPFGRLLRDRLSAMDGADVGRGRVHGQMHLAPLTAALRPMLSGLPLAIAKELDAGAVRCPAGYCGAMPERGPAGRAGRRHGGRVSAPPGSSASGKGGRSPARASPGPPAGAGWQPCRRFVSAAVRTAL